MKPITSFEQANRYLARFYERHHNAEYKLEAVRQLMAYLGNPQDKVKIVHVAGTSGKTSTAYYLAALLTAAGQNTGLTVSPHVDEINERLQINGRPLDEAGFCGALTEFIILVDESGIQLSWFEVVIAFAFWYFARQDVDYAVVEVGLGGLKDASNVISRHDKVAVLTDLGLDHTEILGHSLAEIAGQKIGIVGEGNLLFTYRQPPEVMEVYAGWCKRRGAELHVVPGDKSGDYRQRNWNLARKVYEYLSVRDGLARLDEHQLDNAKKITIPGRLDIREVAGKTIVMDGAHNAQKMAAFISSFGQLYPGSKPAVLISMKDGKDYQAVAPLIAPLASRIVVTTFEASQDFPLRSMDPKIMAEALRSAGAKAEVVTDQAKALRNLLSGPEPVCVITGSFYLLGQIRSNKLLA